jgi:hypothetical protein
MRSTKSSLSLITETLARTLFASAILILAIAIVALLRGISQSIQSPLASDDWYYVAGFLCIWGLIPALLAVIITAASRFSIGKSYILCSLLQLLILYGYYYNLSQQPDNELSSSPLILLIYMAVPFAAIYYPMFFAGKAFSKIKLALVAAAIIFLSYGFMA